MTDPIADMLTRIRNRLRAKSPELILPYSKIKFGIAEILAREGWIGKAKVIDIKKSVSSKGTPAKFKQLKIILKYDKDKSPAIRTLKRISKPGRRVYIKKNKIRPVLNGFGMAILSTSQGLVTDKEARKKGLGGEVICEIW